MRKILWYAFLLIPAVFTSCNLEDDSGLIPQENRKLTISFSVQDPASGLATRAAIAPEAGEENIKRLAAVSLSAYPGPSAELILNTYFLFRMILMSLSASVSSKSTG